jgi:hypothetical protein
MLKFNRNYILNIGTANGNTLTIEPPFTVEFDITRNTLTSANVCALRIYNLSANNRSQLLFNIMDTGDYRPVTFFAGYGSNLPLAFSGSITQAFSVREGVNFITTIESFDGGYAFNNGQTNTTFPPGTPAATVIGTLAGSLPNVQGGYIGNGYVGTLDRGNSVAGNTMDLLKEKTGGGVFIDNGFVNCLGDNECLPANSILIIDDSAGLLATPVREQTILTFDMLFEPRLVVGQQIQLNSTTAPIYNGFYKVISLKHRGMISDAVCGDAVTSVGMFYGTAALSIATSRIP